MNSPIDRLHTEWRRLADQKIDQLLGPVLELRRIIDVYETAVRHHEETQVVRSFAPELASDDGTPGHEVAREGLRDAARAIVEWLSPAVAAESSAPEPETARSTRDEESAEPGVAGSSEEQAPQALSQAEVRDYFTLRAERNEPLPNPSGDRARERQALRSLLDVVGDVPDLSTDVAVIEELERMEEVAGDDLLGRWDALTDSTLQSWLTMLVARLRALRDKTLLNSPRRSRHRAVINKLPEYQRLRDAAGFVNGMGKAHDPEHGSWAEDARLALRELRDLAGTRLVDVTPEPSARKPRSRAASKEKEEEEPIDWPYRSQVEDMHVLLFGGTPREDQRANIKESLGIGELSWPDHDKPNQVRSLAKGVGRFDILLVNKFVAHKSSVPLIDAAKAAGIPFRMVDSYGVETIKNALTEVLERRKQPRAG